jgi:hypothetical protein
VLDAGREEFEIEIAASRRAVVFEFDGAGPAPRVRVAAVQFRRG